MDKQSSVLLVSDEDLERCDGEEGTFTTKQLFLFAWQIAKGMVIISHAILAIISLNFSDNGLFFIQHSYLRIREDNFIHWISRYPAEQMYSN